MFKFEKKYGNIHIDGTSIEIDKIDITEMDVCLKKLEKKRVQIKEEQNEYLSQIIE